jgi:hypothetical protein
MTAFTTITRALAALLLTALVATACGGGTSEADQEFVDALIESGTEEFPDGVDVTCIAEGMVSGLGGASGIEDKYGLTPASFADDIDVEMQEDDARKVVDNMWECDGLADSFYTDVAGSDDADLIGCLKENISDSNVKTLLVSGFMGDSGAELEQSVENDFEAELMAAFGNCDLG